MTGTVNLIHLDTKSKPWKTKNVIGKPLPSHPWRNLNSILIDSRANIDFPFGHYVFEVVIFPNP
ncbi:MAG TPA: hypothetical protein VFV86_09070 [Nitrososphaeraceae archaeon]|nr:hypothetical protein [Nitrososphaeraceae archaeon]